MMMTEKKRSFKLFFFLLTTPIWILLLILIIEISLQASDKYPLEGVAYDPLLGWTLTHNFKDFNKHGYRDQNHDHDKDPNTIRIMFIGDSYTAGLDFRADQIFTSLFEEALHKQEFDGKNIEVMNVAVPAWSTDQQYLYLKHIGLRYSPDHVILMSVSNDIREAYNKGFMHLNEQGKLSRLPKVQIPFKDRLGWKLSNKSSIFQLLQYKYLQTSYGKFWEIFNYYPVNFGIADSANWDLPVYLTEPFKEVKEAFVLYDELVAEMKALCDSSNIQLMIAYIPAKMEFDETIKDPKYDARIVAAHIDSIAKHLSVPYLDLHNIISQEEDPLSRFISWEYHLNEQGHAFTARHLVSFFIEHVGNGKL